jgi:hypothetical protein
MFKRLKAGALRRLSVRIKEINYLLVSSINKNQNKHPNSDHNSTVNPALHCTSAGFTMRALSLENRKANKIRVQNKSFSPCLYMNKSTLLVCRLRSKSTTLALMKFTARYSFTLQSVNSWGTRRKSKDTFCSLTIVCSFSSSSPNFYKLKKG